MEPETLSKLLISVSVFIFAVVLLIVAIIMRRKVNKKLVVEENSEPTIKKVSKKETGGFMRQERRHEKIGSFDDLERVREKISVRRKELGISSYRNSPLT